MVSRRPCKKLDTPALSQWLWLYWPNVLHEWAVRAPDVSLWGFMQYGHGGKLLEFEGWWRQAHKALHLQGAPHSKPENCPTWYDGCRCTVETLEHNIEFRESRHQQYYELWQRYAALKKRQLRIQEAALALLAAIYQGTYDASQVLTNWLDDMCAEEMLVLSDALRPDGGIDDGDPKAWDYGPNDRG